MVTIRLQRTGRRKYAQFRMVVQDSKRTPTSGKVVANLGYYNPHTKEHNLDFDKAIHYLNNGAQPSSRVVYILNANNIGLPKWVKQPTPLTKSVKHLDKLRRNQSDEKEVKVSEEASDQPEEKTINKEKVQQSESEDDKEVTKTQTSDKSAAKEPNVASVQGGETNDKQEEASTDNANSTDDASDNKKDS